ncbi:MAG: competence/damage-inducible protein A [Bacillota bacterium]|nr:competence/damage-inducible protein A [Bacillota bacterium]
MKAEIINVGTELLLGNIVNTNAQHIALGLKDLGIDCYYQTVVGDNGPRLKEILALALSRSDIVILTGGLGPTYDDMTKQTVAEALNRKLVIDEQSMNHVREYYGRAGKEITENSLHQAQMPEGAVVFENEWGSANALAIENEGKTVILLPGPPREMCPLFDNYVSPYLQKKSNSVIVKRSVRIFGIWEATVDDKLSDLLQNSKNPTVAPYVKEGEMQLQVTAKAPTKEEAFKMTEEPIKIISRTLSNYVYGVDVDSLEETVVKLLKEKHMTLATAESCTGGLLAKRITDIAGASDVFEYGFITYANKAKIRELGVKPETLEEYGAVSAQTAIEMADGVRNVTGADIGVSITGIAGPGGGTEEKPVGLVFIGLSTKNFSHTKEIHIYRSTADRSFRRTLAASNALDLVRRALCDMPIT